MAIMTERMHQTEHPPDKQQEHQIELPQEHQIGHLPEHNLQRGSQT
jgi:hypothetical protein